MKAMNVEKLSLKQNAKAGLGGVSAIGLITESNYY